MNPLREDERAEETQSPPAPPARNPLQTAWQRKPLVLLGVCAGVALALIFASQRAPVYQSTAQVLVVKKHADTGMPQVGANPITGFYEDYVSTHIALIRSQVVVDAAVKAEHKDAAVREEYRLDHLPSFTGHSNPTPSIIAGLTATRDTKESGATNVINLTYRGGIADDCPVVINAVFENYKKFLDDTYRKSSGLPLEVVEKIYDDLMKKIEKLQDEQIELQKDAPIIATPTREGMSSSQSTLGELENRRVGLRVRQTEIEEKLKWLEKAKKEGRARDLVQILTTNADKAATDNAFEQQLWPLQLKELELIRDYGEDHPEVVKIRQQMSMTREFFSQDKRNARMGTNQSGDEDPVENYEKSLRRELESIKIAQQALISLTADEKKEAKDIIQYSNREAAVRNELASKTTESIQAFNRIQELRRLRDFGGYDAKLISTPAKGTPVGTGSIQIILAGAALGLLAGVGLAYLSDVTDKSFRNPEEIRRRLGLPIIAHVPILDNKDVVSNPDTPQLDPTLAAFHRPKSGEAEAYRSLRTALYFSSRGKGLKVIQMTSPTMGDGKSTMAGNLAIAIAQAGKRVVLVDADMRRPRVHTLFGVQPEYGLSSVIAGEATLQATLLDSGVDRLSLLTCGPRPENPAELLSQPQFELVLDELRQQFDFVIVDTPPLLAVTDPAIVVARMDGVLLTVRVSKNGRPAAERARELLSSVHANVLGVIVNGVGKSNGTYGYEHYRYGYEYGYSSEYTSTAVETNGHAKTNGTHGTNGTSMKRKRQTTKKAAGWFGRWFHS
jgi:capsular exopolysaccharide synthesis family protein